MFACGEVRPSHLILDRVTGRPRGFAFVEMATTEGMQKAIPSWMARTLEGRPLTVKVAEERRGGSGGGGGGGGGGPRGGGGSRGGGDRGCGRGR